ncbi:pyridoxal-dependent decarboxylase, exosortase A system-associated [Pontixanthobacter gangjinensis]|uniref:Pyridoxal-dependent decarboxylase, exosortase A system-associated n=1 Tax=Pontixanthobacter gangjinensis TaxID=1028742 RepID=A0A6I4SMB8_9SPHN|nr:pyridoxal-dependent decarboxylase, exosortase A system-associated [Pontixanthobacter gangjinensis]MXO56863.1 pyridoxal-dependent decarboxylase, exosortase A system-associated [Pontixanthobacter gangjinensis]
MKAVGPIPAGYETKDGQLAVGGKTARQLVERAGRTPAFVYSRDHLTNRVAALRAAMPKRLGINYAIKANPFAPVLGHMAGLVDGFDIASGGELALAIAAGLDPSKISFAGPGKRDAELEAAIRKGVTLNLESENEARRALAIGERLQFAPKLAIRVNPSFELRGSGMKMGGGAKPFGIDQDRVPDLARQILESGAEWRGLHIFTGSQALGADALIEAQANVLELADQLARDIGGPLPKLNMGGGFGIPYFNKDRPVDVASIGEALEARFADLPASLADTDLCIELGRYLVGEAGVYLTEIVDRKESYGETFLVCDGGLHHQLAASGNFGTVVRRNYPSAIATKFAEEAVEIVDIVGCLCTPLDRLADKAHLPRADVGDLVAVFCAGAYGATASPSAFLGQGPAAEILI